MQQESGEAAGPRILITYPFPLGRRSAGGSRTTPEIARQLGLQGARTTILAVSTNALSRRYPRTSLGDEHLGLQLDEDLARYSADIQRVPQHPLHYDLDAWSVRRAVRAILDRERVDIVLSHFHEGGCLPALLRARGVKFGYLATWQTYSSLANTERSFLRRQLDRRYVIRPHRAADVHFAISRFTERELVEFCGVQPSRIRLCPLGVDPSFLSIPRARPEAITRFLYFGRLTKLKGFVDALEALGKLEARGVSDWTFRIFGMGRREWVEQEARRNGIAHKVEINDPVGDERLRRELESSHLAIMPSHFESFGLSIAEAQAAGIAVVAYDVGSVPEVVADRVTGWLAPFRNVERLADLIQAAVGDPARTFEAGLAARKRIQETFSWESTATTLLDGIRALG